MLFTIDCARLVQSEWYIQYIREPTSNSIIIIIIIIIIDNACGASPATPSAPRFYAKDLGGSSNSGSILEVVLALLGTIWGSFSALFGASGGLSGSLAAFWGAQNPLPGALFEKRVANTWPKEVPRGPKTSQEAPRGRQKDPQRSQDEVPRVPN